MVPHFDYELLLTLYLCFTIFFTLSGGDWGNTSLMADLQVLKNNAACVAPKQLLATPLHGAARESRAS